MAKLRLENLTKKIGKRTIVDNVNVEVEDKEFACVLGESGAGKTTLLRIIAGLDNLTSGKIFVDDRVYNELDPQERNIAMVFQSFALYPHKTAFDNIASPLTKRKVSHDEIRRKVTETAKLLGIAHLLEKRPAFLSGGERQRVAIGRAIIRKPDVLLLDEPLSNLDAALRIQLRSELKELQRDLGQTILYATPDESEALSMGDRIALMRAGKVDEYDTPDNLYQHPKDVYVAGFIGSPSMNLIDCELKQKDDRTLIGIGDSVFSLPNVKAQHVGNKSIRLGIRPHDFSVHSSYQDESLKGSVVVTENLGDRMILNVQAGKYLVKAYAPININLREGSEVYLTFDKSRLHFFDGETGKNLGLEAL